VLWVWPSHLALPALLATVVLARNVDRHPAFLNMIVTEILGGIFTSILCVRPLVACADDAQSDKPAGSMQDTQMSTARCRLSACVRFRHPCWRGWIRCTCFRRPFPEARSSCVSAAVPSHSSASSTKSLLLSVMLRAGCRRRHAITPSRGGVLGLCVRMLHPGSTRAHAAGQLLVLPYTIWLLEAFGTALYITAHPAAVARSGLSYCAMTTGPLYVPHPPARMHRSHPPADASRSSVSTPPCSRPRSRWRRSRSCTSCAFGAARAGTAARARSWTRASASARSRCCSPSRSCSRSSRS
jgi:hypothetical protein